MLKKDWNIDLFNLLTNIYFKQGQKWTNLLQIYPVNRNYTKQDKN